MLLFHNQFKIFSGKIVFIQTLNGFTVFLYIFSRTHSTHVRQNNSVCQHSMILQLVLCFSFAAPGTWNWTSAWNWIGKRMMWFGLVVDMNGLQWMIFREHKQTFSPKRIDLLCIACQDFFRTVTKLKTITSGIDKWFLHYWRQQLFGERTKILDAWITILVAQLREPFWYFNWFFSELLIFKSTLINIEKTLWTNN